MSDRFLKKKNVVGYGKGIKRVGGKKTGEEALLFFVEKKTNDISDADRIPDMVDGLKTDVFVTGKITPKLLTPCNIATMSETITPLRGAMTIGDSAGLHTGTLGAIVKDLTTGKLLAMTNSHVAGNPLVVSAYTASVLTASGYSFIDGPTAVGLEMYQSVLPGGNLFGEVIKDTSRSLSVINTLDTALISIKSSIGVTPGIMGLTKYAQTFVHPGTIPVGTQVIKSGRTSGVTHGEVLSMSATIYVGIGPYSMPYANQIAVYSESTIDPFLDSGDSGAMLVVDLGSGRVGLIGQLFASSEVDSSGQTSFASRLDDIVDELDIRPWTGEIITGTDYPDVVSTAFGAVFTRDTSTFLSVTNDYVCDGTLCGLTPLTVFSAYNAHVSVASASRESSVTLKYKQLFIEANCDTDVGLEIVADAALGSVADVDVILGISLDAAMTTTLVASMNSEVAIGIKCVTEVDISEVVIANTDVDIILGIELVTSSAIGVAVDCQCDTGILLDIELDTDVDLALGAVCDADAVVGVSLDATLETTRVHYLDCDADVVVSITSDSLASTTATDYGGGQVAVPTCDGTNSDDLFYGASL